MNSLIPHSKEEITPELLEDLLREKFPKIKVASVVNLLEKHGTGSAILLRVQHSGADGLPTQMWLKAGFPTVHLERVLSLGLYAREAKFYSNIQPLLRLRLPECYAAQADDASGRGVVILQDLTQLGATFPGCTQALSVDLMASGLDQLADAHSRSWERQWLYDFNIGTFMAPGSAQEKYLRFWGVDFVKQFLDGPVGDAVPAQVRDAQRTYNAFWALQPLYQKGPFCLLHGDPHLGNSFVTTNDELGILDWQIYIAGPWAHDVSYSLVGGLSVDDRRRFERELLQLYLAKMRSNGVTAIEDQAAWDEYCGFIAYGYWVWVRAPPAQQPIKNNIAMSERYGAAMADHHVFERLGV
jgi:hypothetical protein